MPKIKQDILDELEALNAEIEPIADKIQYDEKATNRVLEGILKEATDKKEATAKATAEASEGDQNDISTDPPADDDKTKGKYTITTCNGKPYPSAEKPKVFETLEEAEEVAKQIKGTVDK